MDFHADFSGWSIQTSMQNPESVAHKMAELKLIPWSMEFFLHGFHADFSLHGWPFFLDVPSNRYMCHIQDWLEDRTDGNDCVGARGKI